MNPTGPFDQDKLTASGEAEPEEVLNGKEITPKKGGLGSQPIWIWIFLLSVLTMIAIGTWNWYQSHFRDLKAEKPFLDVTNRQFSVFLWQFPNYLKENAAIKTGYLPGFEVDGEGVKLSDAENYVSVSLEILFLYHTWNRLLQPYYIPRPIKPDEFELFLNETQEWLPQYWKKAPKSYVDLVEKQAYKEKEDLQVLTRDELPVVVRQAYQGWQNYYREGSEINALEPTYAEVREFLDSYPNYARNYWRNIDTVAFQQVAGLDYLLIFLDPPANEEEVIPKNQLATFMKVALYNFRQAKPGIAD